MQSRIHSFVQITLWFAFLVLLTLFLFALGDGVLALPAWTFAAWAEWLDSSPASVLTLAILRAASLAATVYLLSVTALSLLAEVMQWRPLVAFSGRITVPVVRRMVRNAVGLSVVAGLSAPTTAFATPAVPVAATSTTPNPSWPVLHHVDPTRKTAPSPVAVTNSGPAKASKAPVDILDAAPPLTSTPTAPKPMETWTVRTGESLWTIAEATQRQRLDRQPSEDEIGRYLSTLINANEQLLADPSNPDLIFGGQVFRLP